MGYTYTYIYYLSIYVYIIYLYTDIIRDRKKRRPPYERLMVNIYIYRYILCLYITGNLLCVLYIYMFNSFQQYIQDTIYFIIYRLNIKYMYTYDTF